MAPINGTPGNDNLSGTPGVDTINGLSGNDIINGDSGDDTLYGNSGNDVVIGGKDNDTMVGNTGNDVLVWANGDGSDHISGNAGYDTVAVEGSVDLGDSFVLGQQGTQAIFERVNLVPFTLTVDTAEQFTVSGVGGDDTFDVNNLANTAVSLATFYGGAGNDTLDGRDTTTRLIAGGGSGNDTLIGGSAVDGLYGGAGNDVVVGGKGNDTMVGGAGNDVLVWANGDGSDHISGNAGYDTVAVEGSVDLGDSFILGQQGTQAIFERVNLVPFTLTVDTAEQFTVSGVGGDDTFDVNNLASTAVNLATFYGGAGNDTLDGRDTTTRLIVGGGNGNDTLIGGSAVDGLYGGAGNDVVVGGKGNDTMVGGAGNDVLVWANGDGSDHISGNAGYDTVAVEGSVDLGDSFVLGQQGTQAIFERVNLVPFTLTVDTAEQFTISGVGGDEYFDVNNLASTAVNLVTFYGGAGNDTLDGRDTTTRLIVGGGSGNDKIAGGSAADALYGGVGDDILFGGLGNDNLTGGVGKDRFRYTTPDQRIDTIADFVATDDSIEVLASGFGGGLIAGAISADQFSLGSSAGDASDRFIYNDNTGVLYFDQDGLYGAAQVQLATLTGAPTLTAADIIVI